MKKLKTLLLTISVVSLLTLVFFFGYKAYPVIKPCPQVTTDTVFVYDTSWHVISDSLSIVISNLTKEVKYWKNHRDTIKLPGEVIEVSIKVDTAAILKDYFSIYRYGWLKQDSIINIVDSVIITQNVPVYHSIKYKINKPFATIINKIDNSVLYNRYLQIGAGLPVYNYRDSEFNPSSFKDMNFKVNYVFPKGFVGIEAQPSLDNLSFSIGTTLYKFKKR